MNRPVKHTTAAKSPQRSLDKTLLTNPSKPRRAARVRDAPRLHAGTCQRGGTSAFTVTRNARASVSPGLRSVYG
ncbi:hypothetical protein GTC3P0254_38210 [Burkholderia pseudomallei]|nr:hypothetical protein X947_3070 [Burkholderia pseudomallei MSHR7334]KGX98272.1 hypothetical protein Y023_4380 [Burkholderia pseudomallei A79D]KGX99234.1 hypothetical protein X997_4132 [Burkholderia pseudomallei A79C]BEH17448.1 hypothetical protein GTC019_06260 [Burkholderia pseudomallei]BEH23438.1 hypothetical protein GTC050_06900 [Burkholderia pseudomallei]